MELLEAIHTRRSIRKFTADTVGDEEVRALLAAAMDAPSAGNAQPWAFVVVTERPLLDMLSSIHPYVGMLRRSPVAIVLCGDPSLEKYPGYWVQDVSAATQNLLLAAHGMGLGAVWTGLYPMMERVKAVQDILGIPETIVPLSLVPVGRPAQPSGRVDRFREDRVHHNGW